MSKGKWHTTRDNMACAINLAASDPSISTRAALIKAVVIAQSISYGSANYAVFKASIRCPELFKKFEATE